MSKWGKRRSYWYVHACVLTVAQMCDVCERVFAGRWHIFNSVYFCIISSNHTPLHTTHMHTHTPHPTHTAYIQKLQFAIDETRERAEWLNDIIAKLWPHLGLLALYPIILLTVISIISFYYWLILSAMLLSNTAFTQFTHARLLSSLVSLSHFR